MKRACMLLFVCAVFYGCAIVPAALVPAAVVYSTNNKVSRIIPAPAPDFFITDKQTDKIIDDSIKLGKYWGYVVMKEERGNGYLLLEKNTAGDGKSEISVHVSTFFTIGPSVQVFGEVVGGDRDLVSSGVLDNVDKIKRRIEEILSSS